MAEFVTVPGVEIATAGIEWPAMTGPVTVTLEHLADAVAAGNDDPHIRPARVKIGHGVQLCGSLGDHDPFWDGEPAFGSLSNLRLANDGAVLVADLVNVPAWLAEALPSAWPTRSMEAVWDVTTDGGKRYTMVLTAVAVGSWQPAIADLEDLQALIADGPDGLSASRSDNPLEDPMPEGTRASVDVDVIRRRFNYEWATDPDSVEGVDTYWWWARSIRVDPLEVIADDDEGGLWRIPVETDGTDGVTFGPPVRVLETFVDAPQAQPVAAMRPGQRIAAAALNRPTKTPPAPKAAGTTPAAARPENQEDPMPIDLTALRARLGLPEDATEEQINTALAAAPEEQAAAAAEAVEQAASGTAPSPEPEPEPVAEAPEPVAASMATVDAASLQQLQADAAMGRAAREQQINTERDRVVQAAVKAGKIPPARASHWRSLLDKDPEGTKAALDTLAAGLVPVTETGHADPSGTEAAASSYPEHWLSPAERARAGRTPITQEA